jgi:3-hydroxyacyl-CoA dehydrogenase/enoyl-CoA hydratase/3-hydroxybutyryl-CoA epimerase
MQVSQILNEISKDKNLTGQKSGLGFYVHKSSDKDQRVLNRKIDDILFSLNLSKTKSLSDHEIIDRCILTMVNEVAKCLEEGVVKNARYLDMAMIMGTGFPAFRGGLCKYADSVGIKKIVEKLQKLETEIGDRFKVSQLLKDMAKNNQKFYDNK